MAVTARTEIVEHNGTALVFGMEWLPLLGESAGKQARTLAARRRAGYRAVTSGAVASVGLLQDRLPRRMRRSTHSPAAAFAMQYPGRTIAAVLRLPSGSDWLVAVHEGVIMTRTDQLHHDEAGIAATLELLRQAYPALELLDTATFPLLDDLARIAAQDGELTRVHDAPPRAATVVAGGLVLALAAGLLARGSPWFGESTIQASTIDPVLAWDLAETAAAKQHVVHGVAGTRAAIEALLDVPVSVAGWRLVQVDCSPRGDQWQMMARYRREAAGDNRRFIEAARPEWSIAFKPMEEASASWSVAMHALPLDAVVLNRPRRNETRLFSALQAMLPAFSELRLERPQPLPVTAPLDTEGRPIPRPAGIASRQHRAVKVQAPLRSVSLLLPETVHMTWHRIVLQVLPVEQPSLRNSGLRVSLSGVLYEVDAHSNIRADGGFVHGAGDPDSQRAAAGDGAVHGA